jgi:5'-nucleotidase/UDP-sugar diphosphatase
MGGEDSGLALPNHETSTMRLSPLLLLPLALITLIAAAGQPLTLLHFNDFHGQLEPYADQESGKVLGGIARLAGLVEAIRAEDPKRPVLILFAGDLLQGTTTSTLYLGRPDIKLLEEIGVNAAAVGNHEVDFGQDNLRKLASMIDFPLLAANLSASPDPLPVQPFALFHPEGGPRVAVLGLTTEELVTASHPRNVLGLSVSDPLAMAQALVPELDAQSDLLIVLSHLGLAGDRRLAQGVAGVDLIIGGHNHFRFDQPVAENEVLIVQAGERGAYLGRLDLEVEQDRLLKWDYRLIPVDDQAPEDPRIAAKVKQLVARADQDLLAVVGRAGRELSAQRELIRVSEAPFGNLVADLAREYSGAQIALFNAGGFRASIPAGEVRLKEIYQAFPFRNELVTGILSGAELQAALDHSAGLDPADHPGGFLQVSGVRLRIQGGKALEVTLNGQPLDPAADYSLVVPDFLAAGGDGYGMLAGLRHPVNSGQLISDMLVAAFRRQGELDATLDGRIERN